MLILLIVPAPHDSPALTLIPGTLTTGMTRGYQGTELSVSANQGTVFRSLDPPRPIRGQYERQTGSKFRIASFNTHVDHMADL